MYRSSAYFTRSLLSQNARSKKVQSQILSGKLPLKHTRCQNSTSPGSGGSGGSTSILLGLSLAVGVGVGGVTTYAGYDSEFRKNVEASVPFSKSLFNLVHGDVEIKRGSIPLPEEKDLSIPFEPVSENKVAEDFQPIFADKLTTSSSEDEKMQSAEPVTPVELTDVQTNKSELNSANDTTETYKEPLVEGEGFVVVDQKDVADVTDEINVLPDQQQSQHGDRIPETVKNETITNTEKIKPEETPPIVSEEPSKAISLDKDKPLTAEEIEDLASLVDKEALETLLNISAPNVKFLVDECNTLQEKAIETLRNYMKKYAVGLSVPKDHPNYEELAGLTDEAHVQEQFEVVKQTTERYKEEVESLKNLIAIVRETEPQNEAADKAEKFINKCGEELKSKLQDFAQVKSDFQFLIEYQLFTDNSPDALKQDLRTFAVDLVNLLEEYKIDVSTLTQEQAVLSLALKRSAITEKLLDGKKDSKYVEEMLDKQRNELLKLAEQNLMKELKRVGNDKDNEYGGKIKDLEESFEKEMLSQLKRQASAHNIHLAEELAQQAEELSSKHQLHLDEKLREQQSAYQMQLEKNLAYINGIKSKVADVADVERRQKRVQEIWIASQALNSTLSVSALNGRTRTLMPEMISVLKLGERNETLTEIVNSIPEEAALFGVIPEKDLIKRFNQVKQECKKVAMVSEGDSIGMYLLSYVKSLFVISRWYTKDVDSPVNPDDLTSYEILAKAEYFTQQGDLETAAKLMSQLKGVPRKLSRDWLNEVRLYLETKQTTLLLQAYAASLTVGLE